MGIAGAWDQIGDGETIALAQLAAHYLEKKGRPFRIAIDEAVWRFNNLNRYEIKDIMEKSDCENPLERNIFFRVMRLLKLGIQPYFVYDGPARPWKRGGCGGLGFHDEEQRTGKRMLSKLRVPYYQAPGEAEAECALLEREGIVDAIWTDDSDSFMFGAKTVIRTHRAKKDGKGKKVNSTTHVDVYRAQTIKEKTGLDQQGFVLMAIISGGDYDTRGLDRCGPNTAARLVKKGLGHSLWTARNDGELADWRRELQVALRGQADIPLGFPCSKTLKKYKEPNVSTPDALEEWKRLFHGTYKKELKEDDLRLFLKEKIDINTKDYLKHIVSWIMMRKLDKTEKGEESKHDKHHIQLKPLRGKALESAHLLRAITFLPEKVTTVNLTIAPGVEDWRKFLTKKNGVFDPHRRIECEIPLSMLKKGVPHLFDAEVQKAADKAADAEAKAKRALDRAVKASLAAASLGGTPGRVEGSSAKRRRDDDSDASMDEDVQPRSTKQRKTKVTSQTVQNKASRSKHAASSSSPIRQNRGLRVPPAIEYMDLDGFDTSLLDESSVSSRSQLSAVGISANHVGSSTSNITGTKKAPVVVDLLDSSDDDEPPNTQNPISTPPNDEDPTFDSDLQTTREIMIARRRLQTSPRRLNCSQSQKAASVQPSSSGLSGRPKAPGTLSDIPITTKPVFQPPSRPNNSPHTTSSRPLASTPATSISQPPTKPTQTPRLISSPPSQQKPSQIPTQPSQPQPKINETDTPSPTELRRRRIARFDKPINDNISREEDEEGGNSVMGDLTLISHPLQSIDTTVDSSHPNFLTNASSTPSRRGDDGLKRSGAVVDLDLYDDESFVSPEPEPEPEPKGNNGRGGRGISVFIDLTGDSFGE